MQIDVRRTAAVLVGLAMVAGIAYFLVSDSGAEPQPPPPDDVPTELPTPTESPSPTPEPPPELNNTGNDFEAIWRSMMSFRHWMYSHSPSADLLARVYEERCKCFKRELEAIHRLQSKGWVYADQGVEVLEVEVVERASANVVVLEVIDQHGEQILIDQEGRVVEEGEGWPPVRRAVVLNRNERGQWRANVVEELGLAKETVS